MGNQIRISCRAYLYKKNSMSNTLAEQQQHRLKQVASLKILVKFRDEWEYNHTLLCGWSQHLCNIIKDAYNVCFVLLKRNQFIRLIN